jgi:hypothetical protein
MYVYQLAQTGKEGEGVQEVAVNRCKCEIGGLVYSVYTDKKNFFLIYKEIQKGAVAKSYMRQGFLIYDEMRKFLVIYVKAVRYI